MKTNVNPPPPHAIPPRGEGGLAKFGTRPGHDFLPRGEPLENFGLPGLMDTDHGQAPPHRYIQNSNHSPHAIPPRGRPLAKIGPRPGNKFPPSGLPLAKFWSEGAVQLNPSPADVLRQGGGTPILQKGGWPGSDPWGQSHHPPTPTHRTTPPISTTTGRARGVELPPPPPPAQPWDP